MRVIHAATDAATALRRMSSRCAGRVGLTAAVFLLALPIAAAAAKPSAIANYIGPGISGPFGIAAGSDGALWFANYGNNSIGRITTAGKVTNYTDPSIDNPVGIAAGPDGALWFTEFFGFGHSNSIGRITTQ